MNLPREAWVARTAAATGKTPDPALLRMLDQRIRELALEETDRGAGRAALRLHRPLVAGSWVTLEQTWTVGSRPLQPGGKIVIAKQLATDQGRFQPEDPAGRPLRLFAILRSDRRARPSQVVLLGCTERSAATPPLWPSSSRSERSSRRHRHRDLRRSIEGIARMADDHVLDRRFLLPIYLDLDGKGELLGPRWPSLRVVGEEKTTRVVTRSLPRSSRSGSPSTSSCAPKTATGTAPRGRRRRGRSGSATRSWRGWRPEDRRRRRRADFGSSSRRVSARGWSRPTASFDAIEPDLGRGLASAPHLWGETHVHAGRPKDRARPRASSSTPVEDSRLDFVGYSEHDVSLDDAEWKKLQELARSSASGGELIAFLGYEWTARTANGGHHNVLFRTPIARACRTQEAPTPSRALSRARAPPTSPTTCWSSHTRTGRRLDARDSRARAAGRDLVDARHLRVVRQSLPEAGSRVGFIAASDEHRAKPGHSPAIPRSVRWCRAADWPR